uniref:uncharacterized protein LOC109970286 n=1 Tax=Monopterus albus TaxID=43700 RepID=UPI0009B3D889|nr:uncharacterized protein LOC109970286 [Monopterus albus]
MVDAGRTGLFVKVTNLQFADTGVSNGLKYITCLFVPVPVSKPRLWPLSSLVNRPTCWGQPVTVRCRCTKGTGIRYAWYQHIHHKDFLFQQSSDLGLHCGTVKEDSNYYCIASNDVSSEESDVLSVQVLTPADNSCIYAVNIQGHPFYNCEDRRSTTMATTLPLTTSQAPVKIHLDTRNRSSQTNQTDQNLFFSRTWTGLPLWYTLLRWGSFASLLMFLCIVLAYAKTRCKKCAKKKRKVHIRKMSHL